MGLEAIIAVVGMAIALAALFGVFVARYRTSKDDETLSIWRGEAEAWKEKAQRLETTLSAQQKSIDLLTDRINKVEHENEMLRELVTGRKAIEELHNEVSAGITELKTLIKERTRTVSEIQTIIEGARKHE